MSHHYSGPEYAGTGKIVTSFPIGSGVDFAAFDPKSKIAFFSCGDGNLNMFHEKSATDIEDLACLSQLGLSAADKSFKISWRVQKVSTTKWSCVRGEWLWNNQAARSFAMRSERK